MLMTTRSVVRKGPGMHARAWRMGLALFICVSGLAVSSRGDVQIVRVEGVVNGGPNVGLQEPYMKKFAGAAPDTPERVVRVLWESDETVPKGTLVIFQYRTKRGQDKVYYVKTERAGRGSQEVVVRFFEPEEMLAWQVRLANGPRTLATRASANWR